MPGTPTPPFNPLSTRPSLAAQVAGPLAWPSRHPVSRSLTGISPFVGENDRTTLMNIRNYNVAFEERGFRGLTREAKGFVIKVLVSDRL